jgi:ABC-type transport system involved in multi-copper enzyme maturation permease subunit
VSGTIDRSSRGELRQWYAVASSQASHYVRSYRFLGLLGFVALISVLTLAFEFQAGAALVRQQQLERVSEYLSNFLDLTGLWIILAAAFFGGDALSVDFSTGTGYYVLVLPIRRRTILLGRYASATLATLAVVLAYFAFAVFGGAYFFGLAAIPWSTVAIALGIAVLFALAALSVAFFISAFLRSPAAGVLTTVLALYVGFTTLQGAVELAGYEPWWSLTYAGGAMAAALDTDFVHLQAIPVGEDQFYTIWSASTIEGTVIMAAYFLVFFVLSFALYDRKESSG